MTPREIVQQKVRQYMAEWSALLEDAITVERDPFDTQRIVCTVPMHPRRYSLALVEVAPPVGCRR